ncbi:MAG: hypothetical protein ACP5PO_07540 [Desulfurella sp.]|uniref:hypothetical protein n=1 Tax=Desulfurella sp. TaxID=1962857 RepID=UPI003D1179ED
MEEKLGNKDWQGAAYRYFGRLYRDKGNKALARKYFTKAYNIFKSVGNEPGTQASYQDLQKLQ